VDPNSRRTRLFATTPRNIWGIEFSADGKIAVLAASTPTTLTELYQTEVVRWRPMPITEMTAQVAAWNLGTSEVVSWTSTDGTPIEGVLHKPRDFQAGRRYPLLVIIHGGPTGVDYPTPVAGGVYPLLQWLAKGALVLRPNYRGSAGYGEKFRSLNVRNLGVGDEWDVLSGVDHLIRQGLVDSTRLGAMGWSQGGYISAFLTTTTTRFRAISVGAGISDWMTYYVNTDIHPFTRQYLQGTPWSDPEIYAKTSPMTYITQARTPTLIQHGEFDRRVPIPNAYQLYQGLQDMGVPARLVVYKGFGHGINKPKERLAATWHNWQWFAKWIWGEEVQVPVATATEKP
jgi:dipeptidyl aminopeptidase/acylaminoacyl peptidase